MSYIPRTVADRLSRGSREVGGEMADQDDDDYEAGRLARVAEGERALEELPLLLAEAPPRVRRLWAKVGERIRELLAQPPPGSGSTTLH